MATEAEDRRFLRLALSLGRRGMGQTWPNPAVGCVIVKQGRVLGRGTTAPGGRPHAEPQALAKAGEGARGATAYVSLEPCAHHGQTPPCTDALIAAGVARVVAPLADTDARVAGQGFAALREAGIEVSTGLCVDEAEEDHAGFFMRTELGRPFVTLKLASSFDGRIATATGDSQWITGPQARRLVHMMRHRHDAVMVGAGTARADDPSLTVRDMGVERRRLPPSGPAADEQPGPHGQRGSGLALPWLGRRSGAARSLGRRGRAPSVLRCLGRAVGPALGPASAWE